MARVPPSIAALLTDARLRAEELAHGITRLRLSSRLTRWQGFEVTPYLFGGLLVDTGFAHVRQAVLAHLAGRRVVAICCTHHHEDHAGNAAALARQHDCPIYLARPAQRWQEGVGRLPVYRRMWWGPPEPYEPLAMPDELRAGERVLQAIPTPGHSCTHVALYEPQSGTVFSGDLFLSPGASAVMRDENPYALAASLRRLAALEPSLLLTGHGGTVRDAARWLQAKAERVEQAAEQVCALHSQGLGEEQIARRAFAHGRARDLWFRLFTAGDFSRVNFVRAALAHRPGGKSRGVPPLGAPG